MFLRFSSVQQLQLAKDQLQSDYDRLRTDDVEKEKRLREFNFLSDKREQAKQDLKGKLPSLEHWCSQIRFASRPGRDSPEGTANFA